MTVRYRCLEVRPDLGSADSRWSSLGAAGGGTGASGGCWCRGDEAERWLLRRWGREDSALVDDSERGTGSGRDEVGGRRGVRTDCDRMGTSAPVETVVAMVRIAGAQRPCETTGDREGRVLELTCGMLCTTQFRTDDATGAGNTTTPINFGTNAGFDLGRDSSRYGAATSLKRDRKRRTVKGEGNLVMG